MRKLILLTSLLLSLMSVQSQNAFYDIRTINEIHITFKESNWDAILDNYYKAGEEERLMASVNINGMAYDSVGIRYKGNSSYSSKNKKNPLNIKLDHIISGQDHENFEKLRLSNVFKDPSFVREVLSYEIARKYMPASQANYIKVYINNNYIGLYSNIQDVDDYFDEVHFGDDDLLRFKGDIVQRSGDAIIWGYLGSEVSPYQNWYIAEQEGGWEELIGFLDTLNNHTECTEEVLNVDRHIWMLAFTNLLVHLDAPINNAHNYYLCKDEAGQFNPIIWDLNEAFGIFSRLSGQSDLNTTQKQKLNPFLNANNSDYPIIKQILSNPMYKRMYVAHMKTMIEENFTNNWYINRGNEIQGIIDSEVKADANKFFTYANFTSNLTQTADKYIGISELMEPRCNYLLALDEFKANAPTISEVTIPEWIQPFTQVTITAKITDATTAFVKYRHSKSKPFERIVLADDGHHNDGAAGDEIWGASFVVDESKTHFFIYAENTNAGMFSPQRAQHEYYSIEAFAETQISNDIVINEFMASNNKVVSDQDGEYDDWIELYNTTDHEISLNGYYISDDSEEIMKWAFPDTSIASKEYLIIWADDDEDQTGLHTNFKLSASGEQIVLVNPSLVIVNQVDFGEQTSNISEGMLPNGTGEYQTLIPSFNAQNSYSSGTIELSNSRLTIYPNPASQYFRIEIPDNLSTISINIYNTKGQLVTSTNNTTVDTSNFKSGCYFCIVKTNNTQYRGKILVY